jgi:hypothetical protein
MSSAAAMPPRFRPAARRRCDVSTEQEPQMIRFRRLALVCIVALGAAACARSQAEPVVDLTPPPKKPYDAKTQLESGRRW